MGNIGPDTLTDLRILGNFKGSPALKKLCCQTKIINLGLIHFKYSLKHFLTLF